MTDAPVPRRRGRPARSTIAEFEPETESATAGAPKPSRRRKRADVNGQHLKLKAPCRPGFQRRWVNDTPGRIAMAEELAYSHVTETGIKSDSPDSRVSRLVGTQASGAPLHAYLMETPEEEFRYGIEEKEDAHRSFEEAVRRGEDTLGQAITSKVQSHKSSIS